MYKEPTGVITAYTERKREERETRNRTPGKEAENQAVTAPERRMEGAQSSANWQWPPMPIADRTVR